MKVTDAINIIDQAVSQIQANRDTHVALQQAVQTVRDALAAKNGAKKTVDLKEQTEVAE